jgi:hypothetical protein
MKKLYFLITLFTTGLFYSQTNYLVENFDYPADALLSANGWYSHSVSATPNDITVNNGGLSWATYIGSGVGNAALVDSNGSDINRPLAGDISNGNAYASFLFKPSAAIGSTSNYFFHFLKYTVPTPPNPIDYTNEDSAFRARTFVQPGTDPATQFKLGLSFNASTITTDVTADLDITKTYLVVVKYSFIAGDFNDTVSMYVFAEGADISSEPATPTVGPVISTLTGSPAAPTPDAGVIQGVAFRQYATNQNSIIDGIYVRKVWDLTNPGTALGVDKFAQNNTLKVYPNPVQNNRVSIYSSIEGEKEVSLFDLNGRVVLKKTMTNNELDLTNVNKGVYMLQTKVGTNTSTTKLIVN